MSPGIVSVIVLIGLLVLLAAGMPIAFAVGGLGVLGYWALNDTQATMGVLSLIPFTQTANYGFSVIPLFILMGEFVFLSKVAEDLFFSAQKWLGRMPGGLAMSTLTTCAAFAATSGSSLACAATVGRMAIPEMQRQGYDQKLATGVVATGGTLGILIPPSTPLMIFAIITEQSIGRLLIGGVLPGLLTTALYMSCVYLLVKRRPEIAPQMVEGISWKERIISLKNVWAMCLLIVAIIGGLFLGIWTPTEAGGAGAFFSMLIGVFLLRRMGPRQIWWSLWSAVRTTSMIFMIIVAAGLFTRFLVDAKLTEAIIDFMGSLPIHRMLILIIVLAFYILLGCFFDVFQTIIVTLPIIFPVILALGFDPIWFTILIVRCMEVGLITPPFGLNVFIIKGVLPEIPLEDIFHGIWPFLLADFVSLALLIAFPSIVTFLPSIMTY